MTYFKTKLKTLIITVIMGMNKRLSCFILSLVCSLTNTSCAGIFKSVVRQVIGFDLSLSSEKLYTLILLVHFCLQKPEQ